MVRHFTMPILLAALLVARAANAYDDSLGGAAPPAGTASGDLTGSYPGPTVGSIQGHAVSSTAPVAAQVLTFNGTAWVAGPGGQNTAGTVFYADTALGSDSNACTSSGASACATIQAAINKCGVLLSTTDTVGTYHCTVNVAAGTYTENPRAVGLRSLAKASQSLVNIVGARQAVSGTSASYTAASVGGDPDTGSTSGLGNFIITGASSPGWTVDAYKGYEVEALSGTGSGTIRPIVHNTASALEYSTTSTSNPFDATTVFRIAQAAVFVVGQGAAGGNSGVVQFQDIDFSNGSTNPAFVLPTGGNYGGGLTTFVNVRMNTGSAGATWTSPFSFSGGSALYGAGAITATGIAGTAAFGSSFLSGGGTYFFSRCTAAGASRATLDAGTSLRVQEAFAFSLPLKVHTGDVQVEQNSDLNTGANFSASTGGNLVCVGTTNTGTCLLATFGSVVRLDNVYVHGSGNAIQADTDSKVYITGSLFVDNANTALYATNGGVIRHAGSAATGTTSWTPAALSATSGGRIIWTNTPTFTTNTMTTDGTTAPNISTAPAFDLSSLSFIGSTTAGKARVPPTTCALNAASPSVCPNQTVPASSVCWCSVNGTTAALAAGGCDWSLSSTTLVITGPNGASNNVTFGCN